MHNFFIDTDTLMALELRTPKSTGGDCLCESVSVCVFVCVCVCMCLHFTSECVPVTQENSHTSAAISELLYRIASSSHQPHLLQRCPVSSLLELSLSYRIPPSTPN